MKDASSLSPALDEGAIAHLADYWVRQTHEPSGVDDSPAWFHVAFAAGLAGDVPSPIDNLDAFHVGFEAALAIAVAVAADPLGDPKDLIAAAIDRARERVRAQERYVAERAAA